MGVITTPGQLIGDLTGTSGNGGAPAGLPNAGYAAKTPEEQVQYIIDLAQSGAKLTTEQLVALKVGLDGLTGQKNQQLRDRALNVLETGQQQLNGQAAETKQGQQASIDRMNGLNWQATANDIGAVNELRGNAGNAGAADAATVGGLGSYYGDADQQARALGGYYAGQTQTADAIDANALGGVAQKAGSTEQEQRAALSKLLGGETSANAADQGALGELDRANGNVKYIDPQGYGADVRATAADPTYAYQRELARRTEEQDRRSALEASLHDLGTRGIRSGGAEIGALLGSEQNTSQARSLADAHALATSAQMTDAVAQFNKAQRVTNQRWQDEQKIGQEQAGYTRGADVAKTKLANTNDVYQRAADTFKADQGTSQQGLVNQQKVFDDTTGRTDASVDRGKSVLDEGQQNLAFGTGLADDLAGKTTAATQANYDRGKDVVAGEVGATKAAVDRFGNTEADQRAALQGAFGNANTVQSQLGQTESVGTGAAPQPVSNTLELPIGLNEERAAEGKVDDSKGLLGLGGVLGFL